MRDKLQVFFSWVIVALVVVMMFFLAKTLFLTVRQPKAAPALTAPQMTLPVEYTPAPEIEAEAKRIPLQPAFPEPPYPSAPELAAEPAAPYRIQIGSPRYLPAFTHLDQGCRWLGLAGQVFDARGDSLADVAVFASGSFEGQPVNFVATTGNHNTYGPGGYEITVSDHLPAGLEEITVQLFDVVGQPLSEAISISLPTDCSQNLVMVNFQPYSEPYHLYIPLAAVQD